MSFRLSTFGGTALPRRATQEPIGTAPTVSRVLLLQDGLFWDGDQEDQARQALPWELAYKGTFVAESPSTAQARVDEWRRLNGKRLALSRVMDEEPAGGMGAQTQWCWARLVKLAGERSPEHQDHFELEFTFLVESPWYGHAHDDTYALDTPPSVAAYQQSLWIPNITTRPIRGMRLEFIPGSDHMCAELKVGCRLMDGVTVAEWKFTGTVLPESRLVVDCGAWAVTLDGANAYAHFALTERHRVDGWFWMEAEGATYLDVTRTSGSTGDLSGDRLILQWTDEYE